MRTLSLSIKFIFHAKAGGPLRGPFFYWRLHTKVMQLFAQPGQLHVPDGNLFILSKKGNVPE
jgi:hypothetical protein